jgi:hypothetical protein
MDTTSLAETAQTHLEPARAAAHERSAHTVHSAVLLTVGLVLGTPQRVAVASDVGPGYSWQEDQN